MNKLTVLGAFGFSLLLSSTAQGQDLPGGNIVQSIDCSLNEGVTMTEVVRWGRSVPRDENSPGQIYFREAIYAGNYRGSNDFRIASYYPNYAEMVKRIAAMRARPAVIERTGIRAQDLYTCDGSTLVTSRVRAVNPDSDGFSGEQTLMTTRFCRLNEGSNVADAYAFAQGVAGNYRSLGDNTLMQVYTRSLGPVGNTVAGRGVVIASVPATWTSFGARMDIAGQNNVFEGLDSPMVCDYPAMWITNAIHRAGNN